MMILSLRHGKLKIPWSCLGCFILYNQKSANHFPSFQRLRRFGKQGSSLWLKELNSLYEAIVVICDGVLWYARRLMTRTGPLSTIHNGICCCSTAEVDWRRQEFCLPGWFKSWTRSRVQVLGKEPFPSMKEALPMYMQERVVGLWCWKNHTLRIWLLQFPNPIIIIHWEVRRKEIEWLNENSTRWCEFCTKPQHTQETYRKIHGKPSPIGKNDGKQEQAGQRQNQVFFFSG